MKCAICGRELQGTSHEGSKTQKRPTRRYGGTLCHRCTKGIIKAQVRGNPNAMQKMYIGAKR